jgi:hypothetical protein
MQLQQINQQFCANLVLPPPQGQCWTRAPSHHLTPRNPQTPRPLDPERRCGCTRTATRRRSASRAPPATARWAGQQLDLQLLQRGSSCLPTGLMPPAHRRGQVGARCSCCHISGPRSRSNPSSLAPPTLACTRSSASLPTPPRSSAAQPQVLAGADAAPSLPPPAPLPPAPLPPAQLPTRPSRPRQKGLAPPPEPWPAAPPQCRGRCERHRAPASSPARRRAGAGPSLRPPRGNPRCHRYCRALCLRAAPGPGPMRAPPLRRARKHSLPGRCLRLASPRRLARQARPRGHRGPTLSTRPAAGRRRDFQR